MSVRKIQKSIHQIFKERMFRADFRLIEDESLSYPVDSYHDCNYWRNKRKIAGKILIVKSFS